MILLSSKGLNKLHKRTVDTFHTCLFQSFVVDHQENEEWPRFLVYIISQTH